MQFATITFDSIQQKMPPRAREIYNFAVSHCNIKNPVVWVNQRDWAKKLGVDKETVGKWVRRLEKIGRLVFTGKYIFGRYKEYHVVFLRNQEAPALKTKPEPELQKTLHSYQIKKEVAAKLHLLLKQKKIIHHKAAWLKKAIEEDFTPPQTTNRENYYAIQKLEFDLKQLQCDNNHEKTLSLARKILSLGRNEEAEKAIIWAENRKKLDEKFRAIEAKISPKEKEAFKEQAWQRVILTTKFLRKSLLQLQASTMFQAMAHENYRELVIGTKC